MEKNAWPKRPKIILGTPANTSIVLFINIDNLPFLETYSFKKTAEARPIGTEANIHTPKIRKVDTKIVPIPPSLPELDGASSKKVSFTCINPENNICQMIQININKTIKELKFTRT